MTSFRDIKNSVIGGKSSSATEEHTPFGAQDQTVIAQSSRRMQTFRGEPIYSNTPGEPDGQTGPAFSSTIVPGRDEGTPLKPGPAYEEGIKNGTKISHSPGKNDQGDVGRKRPVTY
jgi:hypothetical protein